jgi:hypothetical protein
VVPLLWIGGYFLDTLGISDATQRWSDSFREGTRGIRSVMPRIAAHSTRPCLRIRDHRGCRAVLIDIEHRIDQVPGRATVTATGRGSLPKAKKPHRWQKPSHPLPRSATSYAPLKCWSILHPTRPDTASTRSRFHDSLY